MRFVIWLFIGICFIWGVRNSYIFDNASYAATLSSYTSVATLQNGDKIPIIVISNGTNANINWASLSAMVKTINWSGANIISQGLNWESVRVALPNNGAGTNWQAFGV